MDCQNGRPMFCFADECAFVGMLLKRKHALWQGFAKIKAKTVYIPSSLKICEELPIFFKEVDIETTDEEDLGNVCCIRVVDATSKPKKGSTPETSAEPVGIPMENGSKSDPTAESTVENGSKPETAASADVTMENGSKPETSPSADVVTSAKAAAGSMANGSKCKERLDLNNDMVAQWAKNQYLIFIGTTGIPDIYGVHFPENWKDAEEDGYALPGLSGCVIYAEGTVEALSEPILRIHDGKKTAIPEYNSIAKVSLAAGAGPIRKVAKWIYDARNKRKSMAFTGAGISAESGVPTYRDVGGLWTTFNAMEVSSIKGLARDPRKVWKFEEMFFSLLRKVTFNPGHKAMAEMEALGYLRGIVTQNVDGLHQSAGSTQVIELHGSEVNAVCLACKERTTMATVFDEILSKRESTSNDPRILHPDEKRNSVLRKQLLSYEEFCKKSDSSSSSSGSDSDSSSSTSLTLSSCGELREGPRVAECPTCPKCDGFLKPDGIYFGEPLVKGVLRKSIRMSIDSEIILMVGTSGKVSPARELPILSRKEPDPSVVVEINPNNTFLSNHADLRLIGTSSTILPAVLAEMIVIAKADATATDVSDANAEKMETDDHSNDSGEETMQFL